MKLKLRAAAVRDLDAILDHSVEAHDAETAEAYIRSLETAMDRLLAYPALGAPRDIRPGLRSISAGEHRIFYRIEGKAVVVARVLHKAMDVERHL